MVDWDKPPGGDSKKKGIEGGSSELKLDIYDPLYLHPQDIDLPACTCDESTKLKEHAQLLRLMQFLMGLDDMFSLVRSIILTTDPIPDVKSAFTTIGNNNNAGSSSGNNNNKRFGMVSNLVCKHCNMTSHTIDRCFELVGYPPGFKRNNNNQNSSNNVSNSDVKSDHVKNASHALISDQYQRLMALLSGVSQHITFSTTILHDIIDVSHLNITVAHHNGIVEHVKHIGNYNLGNSLIAKDVLVVPGYHDLTLKLLMGTGSKKRRLGHPSDQVLIVLKNKINGLNQDNSGPCDICHKAKQTREPFPLSEHKSKNLDDLVYLDVWGLYKGGLPVNMWTESVLTATYLINRLPTAVLAGKSPYELVYMRATLGRKAHLLEDKQIPSVGVFDEVFCIWKAFGGNTRDLGSFGEETDKTTDLHRHSSRISLQWLETASQIQRDAVTTMIKTVYGYSSVGRFDVFFRNQLLVFQQHQDESLYDSWIRFKDIIRKVLNHSLSIWTLIEIFLKHFDSLSRYIINLIAEGDLRKFSDIGAWVQVPRCMAWLDYDEHVDSLSTMDNEVGVTSPESTTQTLPSFEEYTPAVTYPKEVKKTLGTLIEVEPLNETKIEEVGLDCNHNTPLSSREVPSFDRPEPQPLLIREELSLFDRPNKVERGRIMEAHRLKPILQQQISQCMALSHHDGRKAYLLEDKQIPSVGVFDEVFSIWKAFGGNTRDLGSFGEETDKTTDLHQHLLRISTQRLETASQNTRDAVTNPTMTVSQHFTTASARTTQPKI
ncbi:hypothetical protein Tco_0359673 [Tanacetum coccineum]